MSLYTHEGAQPALWEVLYVYKGRLKTKEFGDDLADALAAYSKLSSPKGAEAGASHVTLRCRNLGFDPPMELRPYWQEVTNRKGKVIDEELIVPMAELNLSGRWWCPYCMRLRKFKKKNSYKVNNITIKEAHMACPACGISHKDWHVRRHNPIAKKIFENPPRATRSDKRG